MFRCFRVHGDSMLPTLKAGQRVAAILWPYRWLKPGMVVLANHPLHGLLVKRLTKLESDRFRLTSDNQAAEALGTAAWLPRSCLVARVLLPRQKPPSITPE